MQILRKNDESAFYYLYAEQYASNEITSLIYYKHFSHALLEEPCSNVTQR